MNNKTSRGYGERLAKYREQCRETGQKIEQTTMKNSMVEGCMLRIVQRWTFPRPDAGGDVIVAFPFFFKANN